MAQRLDCSQQAISQAERWEGNPTIDFMERWVNAADQALVVALSSDRPAERDQNRNRER